MVEKWHKIMIILVNDGNQFIFDGERAKIDVLVVFNYHLKLFR
jgi:hypothetical protein